MIDLKFKLITMIIVFQLISCSIDNTNNFSDKCQNYVDRIIEIQSKYIVPDYYHRKEMARVEGDFDVNKYLNILPDVSLISGYYLDFLFNHDHPIIYARKIDDNQFNSLNDYVNSFDKDSLKVQKNADKIFLNYLKVNDTKEGYFQYLILTLMADQFYLFWHGLYNDESIICNLKGLEKEITFLQKSDLFEISNEFIEKARQIKFDPKVILKDDVATIRVVTFSKWKGIVEKKYEIKRSHPNIIIKKGSSILLDYYCGINF